MIPPFEVGQNIQNLMQPQWRAEALQRAFWRTCDRLRSSLVQQTTASATGLPFAFCNDGDNNPIIPKHPREDEARWKLRRQLCKPISYVRQITDHFVSHVFARDVQRPANLPPQLAQIVDDADGIGTPLNRLLRQAARVAFIERRAFLLVDYQGPIDPQSAADQATARHVLRVVPPDDVLWVEQGIGNRILSAVVRLPTTDGWILWRVDHGQTQMAYPDEMGEKIKTIDAPKPHTYGRCPLITVGPMPAIIPAVAEGQKSIAQTDSLLRYRNHEDAIPWIVVTGTSNPEGFTTEFAKNPAFTAFNDPNCKAEHIGSDVAVAESLRKTIAADEEQLFQAAKIKPAAAKTAQSPESGVAQAFRFVDADVELSEVAQAMEQAENEMWAVVADAYSIAEAPKATWPRTFVPIDRGEELDRLMLISASTLPEPIKDREYDRAATLLYPGDQDLADELDAASQEQPTPGGKGGPGDGASGKDGGDDVSIP